jgi:hypothetical protein
LGKTNIKDGSYSPEEYARLWQTIAAGEWHGEFNRKKNGELYWEDATSGHGCRRSSRTMWPSKKISPRKRTEEELQQARPVESDF